MDGYTRYEILEELGIEITFDMIEVKDIPLDKLQEQVFDLNIARRQLPEITKVRWAAKYLPVLTAKGRQKKVESGKATGRGHHVQPAEPKGFTDVGKTFTGEQTKETQAPVDTTKEMADMAGVGKSQAIEYKWCQKYIPDLLEAGEAMGERTHTIYKRGQEMKKLQ